MRERRICIGPFRLATQAAADGVAGCYVPDAVLVTHISCFTSLAGSPGTATVDVQDDGTDFITAQALATDALTALTTPVRVAAGSLIEVDLNLSGGTTPTCTGEIALWGLASE